MKSAIAVECVELAASADGQEGIRAFCARRPPKFAGGPLDR